MFIYLHEKRCIISRPANIKDKMIKAAEEFTRSAKTARGLRMRMSVLIPKRCGMSNAQIANFLHGGISHSSQNAKANTRSS